MSLAQLVLHKLNVVLECCKLNKEVYVWIAESEAPSIMYSICHYEEGEEKRGVYDNNASEEWTAVLHVNQSNVFAANF